MDIAKRSLVFLVAGIWIIGVPESLIGMALSKNAFSFLTGSAAGCAMATFSAFHIYHTLDMVLELEEKKASFHAAKGALIRFFLSLALFAAALKLNRYISPVALVLGMLNLKLSAYLVPFMEKISDVNQRRKE